MLNPGGPRYCRAAALFQSIFDATPAVLKNTTEELAYVLSRWFQE